MNTKKPLQDGIAVCPLNTDFHQGGIIDAQGREIPITEKMLQRAFTHYIAAWETWKRQK